jgi:hypothetical protein
MSIIWDDGSQVNSAYREGFASHVKKARITRAFSTSEAEFTR